MKVSSEAYIKLEGSRGNTKMKKEGSEAYVRRVMDVGATQR